MAKQKSDSLIETIRRTMLSETQRDVSFIEHSWWSQLLHYSGKGRRISNNDFRFRDHRGKKLVIAHYFVDLLRILIMGFLWGCYALVDLIRAAIVGRRQDNIQTNSGDWWRRWWRRWLDREKEPASVWVNLVLLAVALVIAIVFLVSILSFGIRSIVLPPGNMYVNNSGVVSIEQPHMEEHHFFLLNAATAWTKTDIRISKGDKVYISASGGFYGDVGEMSEKAGSNDTLLYPRYSYAYTAMSRENIKYCIYGRESSNTTARFGSLLYQIRKQHSGPLNYNSGTSNPIKQIEFDTNFRLRPYEFDADESGVLFFSFNDILLDSVTMARIIEDKRSHVYDDLKKSCNGKSPKASKEDSINCILKKCGDPEIWFKDNIGEVLINVRVEKNIWNSSLSCRKKHIMWFYREMDHLLHSIKNPPCLFNKDFWRDYVPNVFGSSCIPWFLVIVLFIFVVDVVISNTIRRMIRRKHKKIKL